MAPSNSLPIHGNDRTMNLNSLVLANIQASPYFRVHLYDLKTYHQVVDEIYSKVKHLEPWEKGSRKDAGGAGVRGVGTGGIVSSSFCLLYKLFTLKLTRKQLMGLCAHSDSPYIRALGFMYIRFTQPPPHLWEWYEPFLNDREQVDVKAGEGNIMTIGQMCVEFLTKLEWFGTLFPRIPVPVQKNIDFSLSARGLLPVGGASGGGGGASRGPSERETKHGEGERPFQRYDNNWSGHRARYVAPPSPYRSPTPDIALQIQRERDRIQKAQASSERQASSRSPPPRHGSRSREHRRSRSHSRRHRRRRHHHHRDQSDSKGGRNGAEVGVYGNGVAKNGASSRSREHRRHRKRDRGDRHHHRRHRKRRRRSSSSSSSSSESETSSGSDSGETRQLGNSNGVTEVGNVGQANGS